MILVDSNVMIDVIERDPVWHDWSFAHIARAGAAGRVIINHIIFAEAAPRSGTLDFFVESLAAMMIAVEPLSDQAAYLAGQVFQIYRERRSGDAPKSLIADFFIGAHAQMLGATILTRDPRFYRSYFAPVPLITPDKDDHD